MVYYRWYIKCIFTEVVDLVCRRWYHDRTPAARKVTQSQLCQTARLTDLHKLLCRKDISERLHQGAEKLKIVVSKRIVLTSRHCATKFHRPLDQKLAGTSWRGFIREDCSCCSGEPHSQAITVKETEGSHFIQCSDSFARQRYLVKVPSAILIHNAILMVQQEQRISKPALALSSVIWPPTFPHRHTRFHPCSFNHITNRCISTSEIVQLCKKICKYIMLTRVS